LGCFFALAGYRKRFVSSWQLDRHGGFKRHYLAILVAVPFLRSSWSILLETIITQAAEVAQMRLVI